MKLLCYLTFVSFVSFSTLGESADYISKLQQQAVETHHAPFGHWGIDEDDYTQWASHSNRLIPVYTFGTQDAGQGVDLRSYQGENSAYRSEEKLRKLYGQVPTETLNPDADYLDQTNIYDLQRAALKAGKKHIILFVFDGTDWHTIRAANIVKNGAVLYDSGRGTGLDFQDYQADGTTQFGYMVTSPYVEDAKVNVDQQTVLSIDDDDHGGYAFSKAGSTPWEIPSELKYLINRSDCNLCQHAYTDSASSATSMTSGIKTYNASINVDVEGHQAETIAHAAQRQGYRIGVVTSVPISHATPAAAYSHNVSRNDYQDLTRDLLGRPSVSHPEKPLPGVDLLLGAGFGVIAARDDDQGANFVPGNRYFALEDLQAIDARSGGHYIVAQRSEGVRGAELLQLKAEDAMAADKRLLGFFGAAGGHLPFQTADGKYDPVDGRGNTHETYSTADVVENPTLAEMTGTALDFLGRDEKPFWLMVEAGDTDWANHDDNIDNSIGALLSGESAFHTITDWIEKNSSWDETVLVLTADHGHLLVLDHPEALLEPKQ